MHHRKELMLEGQGQIQTAFLDFLAEKFAIAVDEFQRDFRVGSPWFLR